MDAVPASKAPANPHAVSSCCFVSAGGGPPEEARAAAAEGAPPPPPRAGPPLAAAAAAPTASTRCTIPSALSPLASIVADFLSDERTSTVPAPAEPEVEGDEAPPLSSVSSARTSQLGLVARALEHPTRARNSRAGLASGEEGEKRTTILERPASEVMVVVFFLFFCQGLSQGRREERGDRGGFVGSKQRTSLIVLSALRCAMRDEAHARVLGGDARVAERKRAVKCPARGFEIFEYFLFRFLFDVWETLFFSLDIEREQASFLLLSTLSLSLSLFAPPQSSLLGTLEEEASLSFVRGRRETSMARSSRSRGRSGSDAIEADAAAEQQSRPAAAAAAAAAAAPPVDAAAPPAANAIIPTDGPVPDSDTLFAGGSAELLACVVAVGGLKPWRGARWRVPGDGAAYLDGDLRVGDRAGTASQALASASAAACAAASAAQPRIVHRYPKAPLDGGVAGRPPKVGPDGVIVAREPSPFAAGLASSAAAAAARRRSPTPGGGSAGGAGGTAEDAEQAAARREARRASMALVAAMAPEEREEYRKAKERARDRARRERRREERLAAARGEREGASGGGGGGGESSATVTDENLNSPASKRGDDAATSLSPRGAKKSRSGRRRRRAGSPAQPLPADALPPPAELRLPHLLRVVRALAAGAPRPPASPGASRAARQMLSRARSQLRAAELRRAAPLGARGGGGGGRASSPGGVGAGAGAAGAAAAAAAAASGAGPPSRKRGAAAPAAAAAAAPKRRREAAPPPRRPTPERKLPPRRARAGGQ